MIRSIEKLFARLPGWRSLRKARGFRRALGYEETIWTRKVADEEVRRLVRALDPAPERVLEISGGVWRTFGFPDYRNTSYPEYDLSAAPLDERFDLIIAEHIFEHLPQPYAAGRNVFSMLEPGGSFLIVTPFLYRVHPCPDDCTRWTMSGLRHFLVELGFPEDGITAGSWGNRECIRATMQHEFRSYNRYAHSLRNEPDYPIVIWALARRR